MPLRNRNIYNQQAVFVGPSPSIGGHFLTAEGVRTTGVNRALGNATGLLYELLRIQNANINVNAGSLQNVNQFGDLAAIDLVATDSPSVGLDVSYLLSNFINEKNLGFTLSEGSLVGCLSGIIQKAEDDKNYFILSKNVGYDAHGNYAVQEGEYIKSIGNGLVTNYQVQAQVGQFPTVSVSVEGSNYKIDALDTYNTYDLNIPALSSSGTPVVGKFGVPNPVIYKSDFSAGLDGWSSISNYGMSLTGNVDSVLGVNDTLILIPTGTITGIGGGGSGYHGIDRDFLVSSGVSYNLYYEYYIPTGNTVAKSFTFYPEGPNVLPLATSSLSGSWLSNSTTFTSVTSADGLLIATNSGASVFYNANGSDSFYLKNITLTDNNFLGSETNISGYATNSNLASISVLRPGDLRFTLGYADVGPLFTDLAIQSVNLQIPLQREIFQQIGQRISIDKNIQFPLQATLSVDGIVGDSMSGNFYDLVTNCSGKRYDATINFLSPCGQTGVASYIIKGARLQNFTDNLQIGQNETSTFNFTIPIGSASDLTSNIFMSGISWNKPV